MVGSFRGRRAATRPRTAYSRLRPWSVLMPPSADAASVSRSGVAVWRVVASVVVVVSVGALVRVVAEAVSLSASVSVRVPQPLVAPSAAATAPSQTRRVTCSLPTVVSERLRWTVSFFTEICRVRRWSARAHERRARHRAEPLHGSHDRRRSVEPAGTRGTAAHTAGRRGRHVLETLKPAPKGTST